MAAITAFEKAESSTDTVSRDLSFLATSPATASQEISPRHERLVKARQHTAPEVEPNEKGNEDEKNQADAMPMDLAKSAYKKQYTDLEKGEGARIRSEVARNLIQRVDELVDSLGDVSFASSIQFLKRDLAHAHSMLRDYSSESDFLSIVTLLESAMVQLKWKQYTPDKLDIFKRVLDIGYNKVQVQFEDSEKASKLMADNSIEINPRIDFETFNMDDLRDEEDP